MTLIEPDLFSSFFLMSIKKLHLLIYPLAPSF